MNWYKQIKLAAPPIVEERPNINTYVEICHRPGRSFEDRGHEDFYLWFIDNNYQFYIASTLQYSRHGGWPLFKELFRNNMIASGRYDKSSHTASAVLDIGGKTKVFDFRTKHSKNKVAEILDRELNNPKIIFFG